MLLRFSSWKLCVPLLFLFASLGAAAPAPRRVLLLHSLEHESAPFADFEEAFRKDLGKQSPSGIHFYEVSLHSSADPEQEAVLDYLLSMFKKQPPDLLVPIGGPAAKFALANRSKLFPATPMILGAVDQRHLDETVLTSNDTAVT